MIVSLAYIRVLRVVTALSLVLWVAGIGCIFGCESLAMTGGASTQAASHDGPAAVVSGDACAMRADHSCCKTHSQQAKAVTKAAPSRDILSNALTSSTVFDMAGGIVRECPMALNGTALATKVRSDESMTATTSEPATLPLITSGYLPVSATPSFLNNRGHTYLRCCVFLI